MDAERQALREIIEEWAGAECGEPVHAQEAYAIALARRMYEIAAAAIAAPAVVSQEADARRYRWLRANAITGSIGFGDWWINAGDSDEWWDAVIDSELAASAAASAGTAPPAGPPPTDSAE